MPVGAVVSGLLIAESIPEAAYNFEILYRFLRAGIRRDAD